MKCSVFVIISSQGSKCRPENYVDVFSINCAFVCPKKAVSNFCIGLKYLRDFAIYCLKWSFVNDGNDKKLERKIKIIISYYFRVYKSSLFLYIPIENNFY